MLGILLTLASMLILSGRLVAEEFALQGEPDAFGLNRSSAISCLMMCSILRSCQQVPQSQMFQLSEKHDTQLRSDFPR